MVIDSPVLNDKSWIKLEWKQEEKEKRAGGRKSDNKKTRNVLKYTFGMSTY